MNDFKGEFTKDPSQAGIKISGQEKQEVYKGKEGQKWFVDATIKRGERSRTVPFFLKAINLFRTETENPKVEAQKIIEKYNFLKTNGFPVPPTYRISKEGELRVLMTDMTEQGKKLIVDAGDKHLEDGQVKNWAEIETQLKNIVSLAMTHNVMLEFDAYSLSVDKETGEGKVFLVDLGAGVIIREGRKVNPELLAGAAETFLRAVLPENLSSDRLQTKTKINI